MANEQNASQIELRMNEKDVSALEARLQAAMLKSDVQALDQLLADDLLFTNHFGQVMLKKDDLKAHGSGFIKIKSIDQSDERIVLQGDVAIVSVLSRIQGEFGGTCSNATLRFTRVWQENKSGMRQVIAGHSTLVNERGL